MLFKRHIGDRAAIALVAALLVVPLTAVAQPQPTQPQPTQPQPTQPQPTQPQPTQPQPTQPQPTQPQPTQPQPTQPQPTQPQPTQPQPTQPQPTQPQPTQPQPTQPQPPETFPGLAPGQVPPEQAPPPNPNPYPYYYYQPPATAPQTQAGPPPKPKEEESTCCRAAIRFDPFDLLFRRLTIQGELAIWGPISIEVEPSWIFGSPAEQVDASGFSIMGSVGFYLTGKAPQGFFIKAIVQYERFEATVTNPDSEALTATDTVDSPIFGAVLGNSTVFGKKVGFDISGSIGIGIATASEVTITAPGKGKIPAYAVSFYDKGSSIQLLGSLALGIGF